MIRLRQAGPRDEDALYAISLKTGDSGKDATALHGDGRMIGHIYSVPYLHCSPDAAFVAEDDEGVCGYIVGAMDTLCFEDRLEREWWPGLRARYREPAGDPAGWNADQSRAHFFHYPKRAGDWLTGIYPAHLHMNLLPRAQGQGAGSSLLKLWLDTARNAGVTGVHLGASRGNLSGMAFWQSRGFVRLDSHWPAKADDAIWFGMAL